MTNTDYAALVERLEHIASSFGSGADSVDLVPSALREAAARIRELEEERDATARLLREVVVHHDEGCGQVGAPEYCDLPATEPMARLRAALNAAKEKA